MTPINFIYYQDKVGLRTNTANSTFDLFEKMAKSQRIEVPLTSDLPAIAWVVRNVCLRKRTLLDKIKDFFSFLGYESSVEKADRLYYSVIKINFEINQKL